MSIALYCLIIFAVWTQCLVIFGIGGYRIFAVLALKKSANSFPADQEHDGPSWYKRCQRAHLNCLENLPIFACAVLISMILNLDHASFNGLAQIYIGARILQSITHIISTSVIAVNIRFIFFLVQIVCVLSMFWLIINHA